MIFFRFPLVNWLFSPFRVYDSATGEFVWECDDLDHTSTQMIRSPVITHSDVPLPAALLNQSGIYLVKVRQLMF